MSRENVEAAQAWVAAINRGALATALEIADPAIEYMSYLSSLAGGDGVYRGHEGLRQHFHDLAEAWERFQVDVEEYRDLGDKVLMVGRLRAKGRSSGLEVEERLAWVHTFRRGTGPGRYVLLEFFATPAEAVESTGLSESPMSRENVEVTRRVLDAVGKRDLSVLVELTDPEIEWRSFFAELGSGGEYRGHEGLRDYVHDLTEAWEVLHVAVDSVLDAGTIAIAVGCIHYRGKESGAESESRAGWMFKFRDGKVTRFRAFREPELALEAVGLSE